MQQVGIVYAGLNAIRMRLAADYGCTLLGYDARGWYNRGVTRGQALGYASVDLPNCKCAAIGMEGWSAGQYRPTHKTAIRQHEGCHLARDKVEQKTVEWLAWNTDWFNLQQLRAWLATPGAPGSCSLYKGHHDGEFLDQITTRSFMGMAQKHSGAFYDWALAPGRRDDYGDCMAMARALASMLGIGTSGGNGPRKKQQRRKGVTVINI
jgi:hypothetical protein